MRLRLKDRSKTVMVELKSVMEDGELFSPMTEPIKIKEFDMKINLPEGMKFIEPSRQGGGGGRRVDTVRIDKNGSITFGRVILDELEETEPITDDTVVIIVSNQKDTLEFYFRDKNDGDIPDGIKTYTFKEDNKGIRKVNGKGSVRKSGIDELVKLINGDIKDVSSYTFPPHTDKQDMKITINIDELSENKSKESDKKEGKKK